MFACLLEASALLFSVISPSTKMTSPRSLLATACLAAAASAQHVPVRPPSYDSTISVPGTAPGTAGIPLEAFVSYSIESSSFPDFAGNESVPNTFSNNLLNNLGALQGTKPHLRVGGNTQDFGTHTTLHRLSGYRMD